MKLLSWIFIIKLIANSNIFKTIIERGSQYLFKQVLIPWTIFSSLFPTFSVKKLFLLYDEFIDRESTSLTIK